LYEGQVSSMVRANSLSSLVATSRDVSIVSMG
jgi:hypothetical protein